MVEAFFESYQHSLLALGVLATFLVSVVAVRQNKTKARAKLMRVSYSFSDGEPFATHLFIEVQNRGLLPVYIDNHFSIKSNFNQMHRIFFGNIAESPEDFTILPKNSQRFYISGDDLSALNLDHNSLKRTVVKGTIATQDGKKIRVKHMKRELKAHFNELIIASKDKL